MNPEINVYGKMFHHGVIAILHLQEWDVQTYKTIIPEALSIAGVETYFAH